MGRVSTGIDIGTSTVKLLRGEVKGTGFVATDFVVAPNPDHTVAGGWHALAQAGAGKPANCRVGLTGKEINVRYTRVPRLPDWQLRKLMRFEAEEVGGQSETRVSSDFNVLPEIPEIEGEDVVLLAMARETLLAQHTEGLAEIGGKLDAFTPNAIGLYNAFLRYGVVMDDTVLLANIGHENIDVVLVRGADLLFARNMSGGSKLFDEAVAARFEIDERRAERYKVEEGTLDTTRDFTDANQEKAARAMAAPAGQLLSLLQSAILFAKSQVKLSTLKLDRVLLCGGGAALEGLTRYLKEAMAVQVELFDPFEFVDMSKLDPATADALEDHRLEAVAALGLATCGSDPEAYSIEILPEAVRKRRDFLAGPAFLIAAAVLAVLYLGLYAYKESGRLEDLTVQAAGLERRFRSADATHRQTLALLEENRQLEDFAHELFTLKGSGEQMVRALTVLESSLPEDFWLETMTIAYGFDDDLKVERADERPILRLRGRAREGTDSPTLLWEEYIAALKAGYPNARITESMGQSDFTLAMTVLGKEEPQPKDADARPEDGAEDDAAGEERQGI